MTLKQPDTARDVAEPRGECVPVPKGGHTGAAILEPNEMQDLVDALPDVVKAAAGVPLQFHVHITLGDGGDVPSETVTSLNELLEGIKSDFCSKEQGPAWLVCLLHGIDPERPWVVEGARDAAPFRKTVLAVNEGLLVSKVEVWDLLQESIASGICS